MKKEGKYKPSILANHFIHRARQDKVTITNLSLQKLLYFLHGYYLVKTDKSLCREHFQPWHYGPVIESVYQYFKRYGMTSIKEYYAEYDPKSTNFISCIVSDKDEEFRQVFDEVWGSYGRKDPFVMVNISHRDGGAWSEARRNNQLYLADEAIKKEFSVICK